VNVSCVTTFCPSRGRKARHRSIERVRKENPR
jgi:hypothetical protein